jgi:hypothetical protein
MKGQDKDLVGSTHDCYTCYLLSLNECLSPKACQQQKNNNIVQLKLFEDGNGRDNPKNTSNNKKKH